MDHLQNTARHLKEANLQIARTGEVLIGEVVMNILLKVETVISLCMIMTERDIKAVPVKGLIYHSFPDFCYLLYYVHL